MKNFFFKIVKYWHTLRYLRLTQIIGRIQNYFKTTSIDVSPVVGCLRVVESSWVEPAPRSKRMLTSQSFRFLNETHEINTAADWNSKLCSKLWLYNLHYFDDLNAADYNLRTEWHQVLIHRWIDENPPGKGNGWEPYPTSLRIVNWIKWVLSGHMIDKKCLLSLAIQVRFLSENMETHLLGNHLFANAKALMFAGLFIDSDEAKSWYKIGYNLLERELPIQVLSDGGNFELSTMYHTIFLEDLLDLLNIHRVYKKVLPNSFEETISRMFNWLNMMCHPDGEISFFNDAAFDITPSIYNMKEYSKKLGIIGVEKNQKSINTLNSSGYTRVQQNNVVALIDHAAVGPDYLPGHAHADTLSFELSLYGQRVVVNSGTSIYGVSDARQQERSTSAHSTLEIDGENSSEVWSGFRVARRARIFDLNIDCLDNSIRLSACHTGYNRLKGKPIHCREWFFKKNSLIISDKITSKNFHNIKIILPLHPDVKLISVEDNKAKLMVANHNVDIFFEGEGDLEVLSSNYHPQFGLSVVNNHLVFSANTESLSTIITRIVW